MPYDRRFCFGCLVISGGSRGGRGGGGGEHRGHVPVHTLDNNVVGRTSINLTAVSACTGLLIIFLPVYRLMYVLITVRLYNV